MRLGLEITIEFRNVPNIAKKDFKKKEVHVPEKF